MGRKGSVVYEAVDASPVKSFFVSMLTRDIKLEEAILDLLDNCVDGILRNARRSKETRPYAGFKAEIDFSTDSFSISDNCGGIPWDLHDYAFRMGRAPNRPPDAAGTVGVYGIGMKRAIFKIGRDCLISTQNGSHRYEVEIGPSWLEDEDQWLFPVQPLRRSMPRDGTTIAIGDLNPTVGDSFGPDSATFKLSLEHLIATHYAFIIEKGFEVVINRSQVDARPTRLVFATPTRKSCPSVRPYLFRSKVRGVDVFLAVGFTRRIPTQGEVEEEQVGVKRSSLESGWTILCNDRAVLYGDRSELTGWGEAGVPRYHNQFSAISGIVEFRADDGSTLPTTTTKRGIDASSSLYLQVKNKMREGMLLFTDYTNRWKGREHESKKHVKEGKLLSLTEIKTAAENLRFARLSKSIIAGQQFKPILPMPERLDAQQRRITFTRNVEAIKEVSNYLFKRPDSDPSKVGEKCFDVIWREAKQ